jgi:hypothetical protein
VQAVNAGNLIFAFDVVQATGRNHKRRLPVLFRKRHTCCVNIAQQPCELLTDRPPLRMCIAVKIAAMIPITRLRPSGIRTK